MMLFATGCAIMALIWICQHFKAQGLRTRALIEDTLAVDVEVAKLVPADEDEWNRELAELHREEDGRG